MCCVNLFKNVQDIENKFKKTPHSEVMLHVNLIQLKIKWVLTFWYTLELKLWTENSDKTYSVVWKIGRGEDARYNLLWKKLDKKNITKRSRGRGPHLDS